MKVCGLVQMLDVHVCIPVRVLWIFLCFSLILLDDTMTELNLGFNKITSLSPDIGLFLKLVFLDLRYVCFMCMYLFSVEEAFEEFR